jgi:hypothetical protein
MRIDTDAMAEGDILGGHIVAEGVVEHAEPL